MKSVILLRGPRTAQSPARWAMVQPWAKASKRIVVHVGLPAPVPPVYDAVIELWSGAAVDADSFRADWEQAEVRSSTQIVGKPAAEPLSVGVTPGLSQLSFIRAIDGLPRTEVERHWDEHIPLACEIHVGMNRYVQDRLSPAAPWFGMAHLHFPSEAALRDGLFRSAEDIAVIGADVAEFVGDYATMTAIEHIVKA
ncbi:Ethyl tert-butyl ether degradation EthD [Sphingobium chlorophenolicum L-1]|uniref:Ethyl tert-butyl ether degradation EthD n=1 Tax=Sphingobium chlorophenolicum L-1 TaxID=690566 RepID=F6F0U4_SPHCR|nr:EthD family reductase [Sphingobium chlorophenolicum]AEG51160.1 Ethyl tert-butyl ether degradation EthD [Sphingobium chlorophenolicum L-1]